MNDAFVQKMSDFVICHGTTKYWVNIFGKVHCLVDYGFDTWYTVLDIFVTGQVDFRFKISAWVGILIPFVS